MMLSDERRGSSPQGACEHFPTFYETRSRPSRRFVPAHMSPRPRRRRCPATPERPRRSAGSGGAEAPRLRRDGPRQLRSAGQLLVPAPGPGSAALLPLPPPSPPGPQLRAEAVLMLFKERALLKKSGLGSSEPLLARWVRVGASRQSIQ